MNSVGYFVRKLITLTQAEVDITEMQVEISSQVSCASLFGFIGGEVYRILSGKLRCINDVDRLSNLPEPILVEILSILPTKDAVATRLLSRSWRFLWKDIHNLFFSDIGELLTSGTRLEGNINFARFVKEVLLSLNGQRIQKFTIHIEEYCELYDVTTWMASAISRKVKELEFCLEKSVLDDPLIQMPTSIFTCKTLEVLILRGFINLVVPNLACLPNLKTLTLESVWYQCDQSFGNLISACSSLETLIIDKKRTFESLTTNYLFRSRRPRSCIHMPCSLFTYQTLKVLYLDGEISLNVPSIICLPNLKTLHLQFVIYQCDGCVHNLMSGCSSLDTLYVWRRFLYDNVVIFTISCLTLRNLTYVSFGSILPRSLKYKLEINAPALQYLELKDNCTTDFSIDNLSSLDRAQIDLRIDEGLMGYDQSSVAVVKLLQGLHSAKILRIKGDIFKALTYGGACPGFPNLKELTFSQCCGWNSVLNVVQSSNKLEEVAIFNFVDSHKQDMPLTSWREPEQVPICLLSCLETVRFFGFEGLPDELAMVDYILKNAKVLRVMAIYANPDDLQLLQKKISEFPPRSRICKIEISRLMFV